MNTRPLLMSCKLVPSFHFRQKLNLHKSILYCNIDQVHLNFYLAAIKLFHKPPSPGPVDHLGVQSLLHSPDNATFNKLFLAFVTVFVIGLPSCFPSLLVQQSARLFLTAISVLVVRASPLPARTNLEMEQTVRQFLWPSGIHRKQPPVAWRKICLPQSVGGLNIRRLPHVAFSFQAKQLNNLLQHLAAFWPARHES